MKMGLHNLSAADYHADRLDDDTPSLSSGIAMILCNATPLHAWTAHPRLNPMWEKPDEKAHFDLGDAVHQILLEGVDAIQVVDAKDWRTKDAKEEAKQAREAGKVPLLFKDAERVRQMLAELTPQLLQFELDPMLFGPGEPEQTLVWDEGDGVICRARLDWLHNDGRAVDDYKTAHDGNPEHWSRRALFNNGYDVQAAFYLRGLEKALGVRPQWRWVVQETRPPYAVAVVTPGADVLTVANAKVDFAVNLWRECLSSGKWPAWSTVPFEAELQPWAEESKWIVNAEGFVA